MPDENQDPEPWKNALGWAVTAAIIAILAILVIALGERLL